MPFAHTPDPHPPSLPARVSVEPLARDVIPSRTACVWCGAVAGRPDTPGWVMVTQAAHGVCPPCLDGLYAGG